MVGPRPETRLTFGTMAPHAPGAGGAGAGGAGGAGGCGGGTGPKEHVQLFGFVVTTLKYNAEEKRAKKRTTQLLFCWLHLFISLKAHVRAMQQPHAQHAQHAHPTTRATLSH